MSKLPWMPFNPKDWLSDMDLRGCSLATRAIWIDLICLMWECPNCGRLSDQNDVKLETNWISKRIAGVTPKQIQKALDELIQKGVVSVDEKGVIFSRRMVRDADKRRRKRGWATKKRDSLDSPTDSPTDASTDSPTDSPTDAPTDAPTDGERAEGRVKSKDIYPYPGTGILPVSVIVPKPVPNDTKVEKPFFRKAIDVATLIDATGDIDSHKREISAKYSKFGSKAEAVYAEAERLTISDRFWGDDGRIFDIMAEAVLIGSKRNQHGLFDPQSRRALDGMRNYLDGCYANSDGDSRMELLIRQAAASGTASPQLCELASDLRGRKRTLVCAK